MKNKFILRKSYLVYSIPIICFVVSISCFKQMAGQSSGSGNVLPTFTPSVNSSERQSIGNTNQINPLPPSNLFTIPKEESEEGLKQVSKEIYSDISSLSNEAKLSSLRNEKFSPQSKEIRVWMFIPGLPLKGFISFHKQGKNLAFEIDEENVKNNSIKKHFTQPKTGWENWWKYVENLDYIRKKPSKMSIPSPDGGLMIIESKMGQEYIFNSFPISRNSQVSESTSALCNTIETEFNVVLTCQ